uniref:PAS domain-containing protein n=1 Tax=Candidatus Stercorousia sp. TaxID=3048886 RepID=UPI004025C157
MKITKIESKSSHLTTIINNLPLIAFIIDKNYKFVTGNIEALKFFNVTKQEQFRKLSLDVFERKTMELIKEENDLIKKNKKTFVTDREVRLKDGKQQWLRIRKVPILDKKDNVDSLVVFGRSINTERAAQKQRETYISTLSHDLKIPTLAQIRALELLVNEKMGKINDQQRELLNLTLDSCYCMYDMLSTLLTTYKFENNDIVLNYEKIQMLKVLDESFSKYLREIKHKN